MRDLLKSAIFGAGIFVRRRFSRGRATLLNYHRFPPDQLVTLRRQFEYLARECHVLSMSELAASLREGRPIPGHAAVITVDDGHRDFYTIAYPILKELRLPAIMYLPTAFLDGAWLWFDRYQFIFRNSPLDRAQIDDTAVDLSSPAARDHSFGVIARRSQWLPAEERDRYGDRLAEVLRVEIPAAPPKEYAPLRWDDIRAMTRNGIEFGGHTVNHPILETLRSPESLADEIGGCKLRIEKELEAPVEHFAYPSGKADEISPAAKEAVKQAGYRTAVTTQLGQARPGDDPFWLHRIGVDPGIDDLWFRRCVANVRVA
jgi:peptidoglycan/xylan/chitin deacetylase (PgdA/CDA1 family)